MAEQSTERTSAENPQMRQMSAKQMQALMRSAALGDIVGILMQAPKHKNLTLGALRIFILPALIHNQYMLARVRQQNNDGSVAAGFAMWASVSDSVDQRLRENPGQRFSLTHEEWNSGSNLWLVEFVAPSPLAASILKDLDEKVAKGRPMAAQIMSEDKQIQITTLKEMLANLKKDKAK